MMSGQTKITLAFAAIVVIAAVLFAAVYQVPEKMAAPASGSDDTSLSSAGSDDAELQQKPPVFGEFASDEDMIDDTRGIDPMMGPGATVLEFADGSGSDDGGAIGGGADAEAAPEENANVALEGGDSDY